MKVYRKTNRAVVVRESTPTDGAVANYKRDKFHGTWDFTGVAYFSSPEEAEENLRSRGFRPAPGLEKELDPPTRF